MAITLTNAGQTDTTVSVAGSDAATLLRWAGVLLVAGAALVAGSRRRLGAGGPDPLP